MAEDVEGRDFPAVVHGEGRTRAEVIDAVEKLVQRSPNVIVTRTDESTFGEVRNVCTEAEWHETARLVRIWRDRKELGLGEIAVIASECEDIPLAEEAALTAETTGNCVRRLWALDGADFAERGSQQRPRVIIVVAGIDKTLPAVVREGANLPVVVVPRVSANAASSGGGALAHMLKSCAANVIVVNINNGFHAGFVAGLINRR